MSDDGFCVYGCSGSFRAACDKEATTRRGGFQYCDEHADWIDRARAYEADEDKAIAEAAHDAAIAIREAAHDAAIAASEVEK